MYMNILPYDNLGDISAFLDTRDFLAFCRTCTQYYSLLRQKHIMIGKCFTLRRNMTNLAFLPSLPFKVYNLDLACNKNICDADFQYLRGIHTLNMSLCIQSSINQK